MTDLRLVDVANVLRRHRFDREMSDEALASAVLETADLPKPKKTRKAEMPAIPEKLE